MEARARYVRALAALRCAAPEPADRRTLDELVEGALDRPARRLLAYGSLRAGEQHASLLEDLDGVWEAASIAGTIEMLDGYPVLTLAPAGPVVSAAVLTADGLVARWDELDAFEGAAYRRELVVYAGAEGRSGVANCYVRR